VKDLSILTSGYLGCSLFIILWLPIRKSSFLWASLLLRCKAIEMVLLGLRVREQLLRILVRSSFSMCLIVKKKDLLCATSEMSSAYMHFLAMVCTMLAVHMFNRFGPRIDFWGAHLANTCDDFNFHWGDALNFQKSYSISSISLRVFLHLII